MKKILLILVVTLFLFNTVKSQDFVLNNPVMGPTTPAPFPGMLTTTFDFYVAGSGYTFSSNPLSNNYSTITFSFTKLNPTNSVPSGTGSTLFNWVLTDNGGTGISKVYTWTGTTKTIAMLQSPPNAKYKISFVNSIITFAATLVQADVRVAGTFTDPGTAPTGNAGNNSSSIATYTVDAIITPIKLLDFKASRQGNTALLNWQTTSELNANRFDIQYSKDGNQWQGIGSVGATAITNGTSNYTFVHQNPSNGTNYYRLQMVDNDGRFTYSAVRLVTFSGKIGISILPNPVIDKVYITTGAGVQIEAVRLVNVNGQVLQQVSNFLSGSSIDMSSYSAGTYFIKIVDKAGNTEVKTLVKK